jgi:DtxR family transcriptional regulator, Mn-dependent transcriptional regulator
MAFMAEDERMKSPSIEDYIKAIYKARLENGEVTTQDLAARVQHTPPAASKMLKRLKELRLIEYTPYQSVLLTAAGEKMALEIIRHHRLLELYLVQALGYGWDEVHEEAERLEHHISEEFEDRIDVLLGHPTACPHGDPIPTRDGVMAAVTHDTLAQQRSPIHLTIRRVRDEDAALLRHLKQLDLLPGTAIELLEQEPYGGAFIVRVGDKVVRVGPQAAAHIFVGASSDGSAS